MPTFTMTLAEVITIDPDIGLNDYPLFDPAYRPALNEKIVNHYMNQEIGQETISMFKFALKRKMNEIMPRYNAIYKAQASAAGIDPLVTFRTKSVGKNEGEQTSSGTETQSGSNDSKSESKGRAVNSSFPQQGLSDTGDYATDSSDSVSESTAEATSTGASASNVTGKSSGAMEQTGEGFSGMTAPALIAAYAEVFVNTDMEIITELESLFMLVWSTGDSFTESRFPSWYYPTW